MSGGRSRGTRSLGRDARELSEEPPPPWGPAGRGAVPPGGVGAGSGPGPRHQGRPAAGAVPEVHAGARPAPPDFHLREQEHGRGLLPAAGEGRAPGASGAAGRRAFPRVHSGWVPGAQAPPHPDPSSLGAVATVRAEAGASAAWRGLRGAPFLLVALWTGTVSGTVRRFPHGPETLSWPSEAKPALGQTPLVCGMAPDSASPDGAGLRGEQGGESVW